MSQLSGIFYSAVNTGDHLEVQNSVDYDIWIRTVDSGYGAYPTTVRLRTSAGGGRNLYLHRVFGTMLHNGTFPVPPIISHLDKDYWETTHIKGREKFVTVGCDDNPGSALRIHMAKNHFGMQTLCFDEDANNASGNPMTQNGMGPIVWFSRVAEPRLYDHLQPLVNKGRAPKGAMGLIDDYKSFTPLKLETV